MKPLYGTRFWWTLLAVTSVVLLCPQLHAGVSPAEQGSTTEESSAQADDSETDQYDRVALVWNFERLAKSGLARGQELYYMRCWFCHNEYGYGADPTGGPSLRDIATRMTDEDITTWVRGGAPGMPAYNEATLSEQSLADLLTYLRQKCGTFPRGGGCFDEHDPPENPRFRAEWDRR